MHPKIWGPALWSSLLHIVLNYPEHPDQTHKNELQAFITSLGPVLPCIICQNNYKKHIVKTPPVLNSRTGMLEWLVELHNISNPKHSYNLTKFVKHYSVNCLDMIKSTKKDGSSSKKKKIR